jgi:hypothetical protein
MYKGTKTKRRAGRYCIPIEKEKKLDFAELVREVSTLIPAT